MLTKETNEMIVQVGSASPAGQLLRNYWYPVTVASHVQPGTIKKIQLLDETFVLFKDLSGRLGLVSERCSHRGASLAFGIPQADGIRCAYHGWKFAADGACTDIPYGPSNEQFRKQAALPCGVVRECGGLIFAYIGKGPAPRLPLIDALHVDGARKVKFALVPCNWFQVMENSFDPVHLEWLHGHFHNYKTPETNTAVYTVSEHEEIEFLPTDYGFLKRRVLKGQPKTEDDWQVGQQIFFPNMVRVSKATRITLHMKVPVTETLTAYYWYECDTGRSGELEYKEIEYMDAQGNFRIDTLEAEDIMIFLSQGPVADRTREQLYEIDKGIIQFRRKFVEQVQAVAAGSTPLFVHADDGDEQPLAFPVIQASNSRSVLEYADADQKPSMKVK